MRKNFKTVFRGVIFTFIILIFFILIQHIFVPKWYYPDLNFPESITRSVTGFYEEDKNSIDVVAIGASTILYGWSPMCAYDKYGIKSYNLASSSQPTQVAYYAAADAIRTQKPKIIMVDVAPLFCTEPRTYNEENWLRFMSNMPLSINRLKMAYDLSHKLEGNRLLDLLVPFMRYHDRWSGLTKSDFTDFYRNRKFYGKGYCINSLQVGTTCSLDTVNNFAQQMIERGMYEDEHNGYSCNIVDEDLEYFLSIKKMCDENNIAFVAIKMPAVFLANGWSVQKYEQIKKLCEENDIAYYDMNYGHDVGIDWNTDTQDAGAHLNLLGAQKATESLGKFLVDNYDLDVSKNDKWDKDLADYNKVKEIALLQMNNNFTQYVDVLCRKYSDKVIFITVNDDFYENLNEDDKKALKQLGLQTAFEDSFRKAYIAVIENGTVIHEDISDRQLTYSGKTRCGNTYSLTSASWLIGANAQININNTEYALNKRGFNIVVFDDELNMVLDSVVFDTAGKEHIASRGTRPANEYLREYESYIIEQGKELFLTKGG